MDGWEDGGGDDLVHPLSFLFGGAENIGVAGETRLAFSVECPPLISKLKALPLWVYFAVSSNMLASFRLCLVCLSVRVSL